MKHNHEINEKTGADILNYLRRSLTENQSGTWSRQDEHFFTAHGILQVTLWPNPTEDEPGNGDLKFFYLEHDHYLPNTWDKLKEVMQNKKFIDQREDFMNQTMKTVLDNMGPDPDAFAANFMLLFAIARRVSTEKDYPLNREDTEAMIEKVFSCTTYSNCSKNTYENMVSVASLDQVIFH